MSSNNSMKITIGKAVDSIINNIQQNTSVEQNFDLQKAALFFDSVLAEADQQNLGWHERSDLQEDIGSLKQEVLRGGEADETRMGRLMRNIKRMAPEILGVIVATALNPAAGLGLVAEKVARRMVGGEDTA